VYSEVAANYYVEFWYGDVYVWSDAEGVDIMTGVEFIQFADMTMPVPTPTQRHYGDESDNVLIGGTGFDVMYGAGGDDILVSGPGGDALYGGAGTDTAVFSDVLANYQLEWHEDYLHVVQLNADQNNLDSLYDIEFLQFADVTIPLPANLSLIAGDGNDNVLTGTAGDDLIQAGAGDDTITGGGGYDLIYGGAGIDTAVFSEDSANYVIEWHLDHSHVSHVGGSQADGTYSLTDVEVLQFADIAIAAPTEPLTLYGSLGDDTLSGAGGFDTLYGRHGDDVLDGGRGDDKLSGDLGDDRYTVSPGDGQDIIFEQGGTDKLVFDGSTDPSELWFDQRNSDLVISRLGTRDSVIIAGWFDPFSGPSAQVEDILAMNGSMALHAADVNSLISQMAAFSAQVGSDPSAIRPSDLAPEYQVAVNSVWHANAG
jgi:hypothetical protein